MVSPTELVFLACRCTSIVGDAADMYSLISQEGKPSSWPQKNLWPWCCQCWYPGGNFLGKYTQVSQRDAWKVDSFSCEFWGLPWWNKTRSKLVHPRKLTWHPKIDTWKRRFLLETIILRFHVSFRECSFKSIQPYDFGPFRKGSKSSSVVWIRSVKSPFYQSVLCTSEIKSLQIAVGKFERLQHNHPQKLNYLN